MNYNRCCEFVKSQSDKIDEISKKYDPQITQAKNLNNLLRSAGIDFESEVAAAGALAGCSSVSTSEDPATASLVELSDGAFGNGDFVPYTNRQYQSPHDGNLFQNCDSSETPILRLGDRLFFGGIDGGTSVCVSGSPAGSAIFEEIDKALELSREKGRPVKRNLGGLDCLISPSPGGGCVHYHCKIEFGGCVVLIHRNPCKTIPTAKIIYSWAVCDQFDLEQVQERVVQWLQRLGIEKDSEWLSRLDIQVTASMDLSVFYKKTIDVDYRCRIRKPHFYADGEFPEGVYFGSHRSPIFARLYDKWREAFGNSEEKCLNLLERFQAGNYDVMQNPVTRFEFEAHRQFLNAVGINTFDDLKKKGQGYVVYLCNWLRFLEKKTGRHTERESVCSEWQEVTQMFQLLFSTQCPVLHRKKGRTGGFMSISQYKRLEATVGTHLAKMLLHRVQRNNSDPKTEFQKMLQDIFPNVVSKFKQIHEVDEIQNITPVIENLIKVQD